MIALNTAVTVCYYLICAFFLAAMLWNFFKTRRPQEAVLYAVMIMPFALRLARLK